MTLVGRLTAFLLTALAVVLIGFATTLFVLSRGYLDRQLNDRLESALDTMAATADVTPDGVEWESQRDRLRLGQDIDNEQVRWAVFDGRGRIVDHSRNLAAENLQDEAWSASVVNEPAIDAASERGQPWRIRHRRLQAGGTASLPGDPADAGKQDPKYPVLILRAGASLQPMRTTLWNLAATLAALSIGVWSLAVLLGRRLCRRALAPLIRMTETARSIHANDLTQRMPATGTRDELDDLGRAFNDLLSRLQEAFERQRQFTGEASHQLRTPLAVMLGQVEVAARRERSAEEYRRVLGIVAEQGTRLNHLVDMLLFLARADADARAPSLTIVPLAPWLQEHLRQWSPHPRAADIHLALADGERPAARLHAPLCGQIVDILLDNACQYSRPGTPITVSCYKHGGIVELAVEDHGCGIDEADLPRVFEPFFRSPRIHDMNVNGVGLGLAIARRVTEAMGGSIEAKSQPGAGTRFVVKLLSA